MNRTNTPAAGFSLIEIILGCALFSMMAVLFITSLATITNDDSQAGRRNRAAFLSEEGLEAARSIRNQGFATLVAGTFGVSTTPTGSWLLLPGNDQNGVFTRTVTITDVDSSTKKITAAVAWSTGKLPGLVTLSDYLTNWADVMATSSTSTLCQ